MAIQTLNDARVLMGGYSLATRLNQVNLSYDVEEVDATCFGDGARTTIPGFKQVGFEFNGYYDSADTSQIDPALAALHAVSGQVLTVCPTAGTVGDIGFTTTAMQASITRGGSVGEMLGISASGKGSGKPLVRGYVLANGAKTATGNGAAVTAGAASASQYLYGSLHVTAVAGTVTPTITVKIQSDDNSSFTSATDRITFTAATAIGAQWATPVAGAITDTYWRATWTVSGTDPSLTVFCTMGIQ